MTTRTEGEGAMEFLTGGSGTIQRYFTVWCAGCYTHRSLELANSKRQAGRDARNIGWRQIKRLWYCPDCVLKREGGHDADRP